MTRRSAPVIIAAALLGGCALANAHHGPTVYPLTQVGDVNGLAPGPDGRMWFTMSKAKAIGAISSGGSVQMYQNPVNIDADGHGIAAGPDGAMWFTQVNPHVPVDSGPDMIGRVTMSGAWSEYPIASWDAAPEGITAGPDHAMWFAERHANAIGRISMRGQMKEYPLPHAGSGPTGIARGIDGKIWFTETDGDRIGRIDPSNGSIVEFAVPVPKSKPGPIVAAPNGDLYFVELARRAVARMTRAGAFGLLGGGLSTQPADIALVDGEVWVVGPGALTGYRPSGTAKAAMTTVPLDNAGADVIAMGPHGTIWFAERQGPTFNYTGLAGIGLLDARTNIR